MNYTVTDFSQLYSLGRWDPRSIIFASREKERNASHCKLAELVAEVKKFESPPREGSETFTYIGLENVESLSGDLVGNAVRRGGDIKSRCKKFGPNDVLYGRLRPSLAKAFWCGDAVTSGMCSTEFIVLRPRDGVSGRVIREILGSRRIAEEMSHRVVGAALPRVSAEDLLAVDVPDIRGGKFHNVEKMLLAGDERRKEAKTLLLRQPQENEALLWG